MSSSECPPQPIRYGLSLQAAFEVLTVQGPYLAPLGIPGGLPQVEDDRMDTPLAIVESEKNHLSSTPRSTTMTTEDVPDFGDFAVEVPTTSSVEKSIGSRKSSSVTGSTGSSSETRADTGASPCDSSLDKVIKECLTSNPFTSEDTAGGDGTESGICIFDTDHSREMHPPPQEETIEAETKTSEWTAHSKMTDQGEQEPMSEERGCGSTVTETAALNCSEEWHSEEQKVFEKVIESKSLEGKKKQESEQPNGTKVSKIIGTPNRKLNQPRHPNLVKRTESMKEKERRSLITIKRTASSRLVKNREKESGSPKKMSAHDQKCLNHPRWLNRLS